MSTFRIKGTTQLLGVIGDPITHSLSPVMQNAALAQLGADFVYLPFPVASPDLADVLSGFRAIGLRGFNVTIPHKQAIMPLLSEISPVAQAVGAVNTVCRTDQGWYGTNTDIEGFLAPLVDEQRDWSSAVILGNGGAARAVVAGCGQLGCRRIQVVGRSSNKLDGFMASWQDAAVTASLSVHSWSQLPDLLPTASLLVNTTPIGMHPHSQASLLTSAELALLPDGAIVYDLIYRPRPTLLLQQAQSQGAIVLDGLEMLVQQGAAALRLWVQQPVPVDVMRESLLDYFGQKPLVK